MMLSRAKYWLVTLCVATAALPLSAQTEEDCSRGSGTEQHICATPQQPAVRQQGDRRPLEYLPEKPKPQFQVQRTLLNESEYHPLNHKQKFELYLSHTHAPTTFVSAAVDASYSQLFARQNDPRTLRSLSIRYSTAMAASQSDALLRYYVFPVMLRQDPRYFRRPDMDTTSRVTYALSRVVITRSDAGTPTLNTSNIFGVMASESLANTYRPYRDSSASATFGRVGVELLSQAGMNLWREFGPEIRDKFVPKRFRRK
jgi:hypothetical protein